MKRTEAPGKLQSGSSSISRRYKYTKVLDNRKHAIRGLSRRSGSFVARITAEPTAQKVEMVTLGCNLRRRGAETIPELCYPFANIIKDNTPENFCAALELRSNGGGRNKAVCASSI